MDTDDFAYDFDAPGSDWNYEPSRADLFRQIDAPLYTTDPDGWLTYYNEAATDLWGFRPVLGKARWCGAWRLFEAGGAALPHDRSPLAVTLKEGRTVRGCQMDLERPDGARLSFMPYPTLLRDRTGTVMAAANILLKLERSSLRLPLGAVSSPRSPMRPAQAVGMHRCSA